MAGVMITLHRTKDTEGKVRYAPIFSKGFQCAMPTDLGDDVIILPETDGIKRLERLLATFPEDTHLLLSVLETVADAVVQH
jgi:hypothetical protein